MEIGKDIDKEDTYELFAQLVGRIVMNHEYLNQILYDIYFLLCRDINDSGRARNSVNTDLEKLLSIPATIFFDRLSSEVLNKGDIDSQEIIQRVVKMIACFNEPCEKLGKPFNKYIDLNKKLEKALNIQNNIRNKIVYNLFLII